MLKGHHWTIRKQSPGTSIKELFAFHSRIREKNRRAALPFVSWVQSEVRAPQTTGLEEPVLSRLCSEVEVRAQDPSAPPQPILLHDTISVQPAACTANDHLYEHRIYKLWLANTII